MTGSLWKQSENGREQVTTEGAENYVRLQRRGRPSCRGCPYRPTSSAAIGLFRLPLKNRIMNAAGSAGDLSKRW